MNKKQILGLVIIIIAILMLISGFVYTKLNPKEVEKNSPQKEEYRFELNNSVQLNLTPEQEKEGVKAVYNDTKNNVLLIDK